MKERLMEINSNLKLNTLNIYLKDEAIPQILIQDFDYVVDGIDTLSPKIFLLKLYGTQSSPWSVQWARCTSKKITDVSKFYYGCPFAQVVRKKLHGWGIHTVFKVVFSPEPVPKEAMIVTTILPTKSTVGTISYTPRHGWLNGLFWL
ncbi:MAG: hypothetical protein R2764_08710 [Bacteroidales bacterium]